MDVIVLTFLVVNGYAAAMVGRLRNLPLTFVGGLLLGLIGSYTVAYFNLPDWLVGLPASLPTIFLFIMLLALPEARLRAGRLVGSVMPRVPGLRRSFGGAVGLVAAAGVLSMLLAPSDLIRAGQGLALACRRFERELRLLACQLGRRRCCISVWFPRIRAGRLGSQLLRARAKCFRVGCKIPRLAPFNPVPNSDPGLLGA